MPSKSANTEAISKRREQLREEAAAATRERIQTTNIVERLQRFALGDAKVKMTPAQIKAAEMLLDKTLPNLSSVKLDMDAKKVVFNIGLDAVKPAESDE